MTLNLRDFDANRWAEIDRVLEIVLELPARERGRALERLCANSPALRQQALEVLRADRKSSDFLAGSAIALLKRGQPGRTRPDGKA